jgi:hypothetical protein
MLLAHSIMLHAENRPWAVLLTVEVIAFEEFELICEEPMSSTARLSISPMEPTYSARSLLQDQQTEESP